MEKWGYDLVGNLDIFSHWGWFSPFYEMGVTQFSGGDNIGAEGIMICSPPPSVYDKGGPEVFP
jgi:hypothetical protein